MMDKKRFSTNQQKILIVFIFLFAVLAAAGILVNVSPLWRALNALVWISIGIMFFIALRKRDNHG